MILPRGDLHLWPIRLTWNHGGRKIRPTNSFEVSYDSFSSLTSESILLSLGKKEENKESFFSSKIRKISIPTFPLYRFKERNDPKSFRLRKVKVCWKNSGIGNERRKSGNWLGCLYRVMKSSIAHAMASRTGLRPRLKRRFNNRGASRRASWHASSPLIYNQELFFRRGSRPPLQKLFVVQ